MEEWCVNLIVGLSSGLFGFLSGILTKTYFSKHKQKIRGNNNIQFIGNINNEKKSNNKRK